MSMTNSYYMNIGNIVLNYIFIFILNMSVKGAAIATLLSRMFCSFIILYMLLNKEQIEKVSFIKKRSLELNKLIMKKELLVQELESYKKSLIYEVVTGKREV